MIATPPPLITPPREFTTAEEWALYLSSCGAGPYILKVQIVAFLTGTADSCFCIFVVKQHFDEKRDHYLLLK